MRVLILHNRYKVAGGEDVVVRNEIELLRRHGHDVFVQQKDNEAIGGVFRKAAAAISAVFSLPAYMGVRRLIRAFRPDVVHVHNFFPLFSPSVFYACRHEATPVVATLHNYRIVCPTALLMHNGKITERSLRDGPWWAIPERVYRRSIVGTTILALMIHCHRVVGTWRRCVNRFIVLTDFAARKFESAGLPANLLAVKPNFVDYETPFEVTRQGVLFVGRCSPEKGVDVLLRGMEVSRCELDLTVVCALPEALGTSRSRVRFVGEKTSSEVRALMSGSQALVLPSVWYEGFPMVLVEAYACGLPVIASRLGSLEELVEDGVTGLLFNPGDSADLAAKLEWVASNADRVAEMGRAARALYEAKYSGARNHAVLLEIYQDAIAEAECR